ncbi:hypothetical protein [Flavobacterium sp. TAB 87]|uniref:hypothetical protein n=1 Tax=Flavobacterium sp. TAB 87 TaxID=1729581 RepID=UPI00076C64E6|nr:hypothetical protein [Flavobacterium sp. TAB 87]KVV15078.1 hypothetical protein AP058_01180 [Flavobacterium sp. TAB 87]
MSTQIVLLLLVICVVFYFSWLSDPSFVNQIYLPKWLLKWHKQYYNLRTAISFISIGFFLEVYTQHKNSWIKCPGKNVNLIQNLSFATIMVCIAEAGKLLITKRTPDLLDVFFGFTRSLKGALFYNLYKRLRNAK